MARFEKGRSGNPSGRPPGRPDKRNVLRRLLEPHAGEIVDKAIELAKAGDTTALRLCLERLIPPLRAQVPSMQLVNSVPETLSGQGQEIIIAMLEGRVSPDTATIMVRALSGQARIIEVDKLVQRIEKLEAKAHER